MAGPDPRRQPSTRWRVERCYHARSLWSDATVHADLSTFWLPRPTQHSVPSQSVPASAGRQRQVWFIPSMDKRGVCRWNCEIPCMPHLSMLEVFANRRYTIWRYLTIYLYKNPHWGYQPEWLIQWRTQPVCHQLQSKRYHCWGIAVQSMTTMMKVLHSVNCSCYHNQL